MSGHRYRHSASTVSLPAAMEARLKNDYLTFLSFQSKKQNTNGDENDTKPFA